jgi:hypothetical protein
MEDERRDVRHGTLSYASMRSVACADIDALLDDEAIRQIVGPGAEPCDLPWRLPPNEDLGPEDGVHQHLILEDGRPVGMITFTEEWGSVAVGFWLTAGARGRGVLHGAWGDLAARHGPAFEAGCWRDNAAAARFLTSIGMRAGEEWCHDGRWAVHWESGPATIQGTSDESGE